MSFYAKYIKRMFDIAVSLPVLIILFPLLLLTALIIKLDSRGPVLFWQDRVGRSGKVFRICKYRSMVVNAERSGSGVYSAEGDARVTRVGRIIRALSIDELPQLFNIIRGDMSLIGFRPPLTYHPWPYEEYTDEQKLMFRFRPGVTGWAQVHGRKTVLWEDRIQMGCWYADNVSFMLDAKIFFLTVLRVIKNEANVNTEATAPSNETMYTKQND